MRPRLLSFTEIFLILEVIFVFEVILILEVVFIFEVVFRFEVAFTFEDVFTFLVGNMAQVAFLWGGGACIIVSNPTPS